MTISTSYLYEYLRGIDSRIEAKTDEKLLDIANYGIANLSNLINCFYKTDVVSLEDYANLGVLTFDFVPNVDELIGYHTVKFIDATGNQLFFYNGITAIENADKSYTITFASKDIVNGVYASFGYFYTPVLEDGDSLDIDTEIFHFLKHSMQIVLWGGLKDYEKEQYHQDVLDTHIKTKILSYPADMNMPLKGGYL